jgi:flagellar FliL protein
MAPEAKKEKAEEKAEGKTKGSPSGLGGFLPVVAVVVLVPVLSFVMVEYVLFPRLETKLAAMGVATAEGVEIPTASHEEAHGKKPAADAAPTHAYEFSNIVSNLAGSMKSRYVKVSFTAYSSNPEFEHIVETNKAKLLDSALGVLSGLSLADLESPGVKNKIRTELIFGFETAMGERLVEEIYFSEFVIQ